MDADVYVVPEIAREDKIKLPDGFEMNLSLNMGLTETGSIVPWAIL